MTAAIAALYEDGIGAFVAADHMTIYANSVKRVRDDICPKIFKFDQMIAFGADSMLNTTEIIRLAQQQRRTPSPADIHNAYKKFRLQYLIDTLLAPRGFKLEDYHAGNLPANLFGEIDEGFAHTDVCARIGFAYRSGNRIRLGYVASPGELQDWTPAGLITAGSFEHLMVAMFHANYDKGNARDEVQRKIIRAMEFAAQTATNVSRYWTLWQIDSIDGIQQIGGGGRGGGNIYVVAPLGDMERAGGHATDIEAANAAIKAADEREAKRIEAALLRDDEHG